MKKQPELTAQTKQNIIDAFWQIYCNRGIEKITVKEITAKAGYNRSTFYEYFIGAHAVLEEIENSLLLGPQDLPPLGLADNSSFILPVDIFLTFLKRNSNTRPSCLVKKGIPPS